MFFFIFACYFLYPILDAYYFCSRIEPFDVVFPAFFFSFLNYFLCLNCSKLEVVGCLLKYLRAVLNLMTPFTFIIEPRSDAGFFLLFYFYFIFWGADLFWNAFLRYRDNDLRKVFQILDASSFNQFSRRLISKFFPIRSAQFPKEWIFLSLCSECCGMIGK